MRHNPIQSSIALLLIILISAGIIGWLTYGEQGALTETVEVGSEGIRKAEEVKRLLEESAPVLP